MKQFFALLFSLAVSYPLQAQFTNILISPTGCTEPSICINPTDISQVVAATNCTYSYFSSDTGQTWSPCMNPTITPGLWCYDPCIIADMNGHFYYFHNNETQITPRATVQKSFNGGQSWTYDNGVPDNYDKEMACVRPSTNEIYAVYYTYTSGTDIGFSRSADGGVTWTPRTWANTGNYTSMQIGAAIAVGAGIGDIYVVWKNDAGIMFQRSFDNGATWAINDYALRTFINSGNGHNCMPSISTDLSAGPNNGNIYITWYELDVNGVDTDIYFAKSTDQGGTWSISNIASDINTDQKWPQITLDQMTGNIYVLYYEGNNPATQHAVKMAFSVDGGSTFTNVNVANTPANVTNWFHHYIGNSAHNGVIRPAWTTNDSFYTALITQTMLDQWLSTGDHQLQSALNIYPNPSPGEFFLTSPLSGELSLINAIGETVMIRMIGIKEERFDIASLPSGLYIVSLKTDKGTATQRLIKK